MKKIILLFALLLSAAVNAQNDPGNRPELLLNKEVKIVPLPAYSLKEGYDHFYEFADMVKMYRRTEEHRYSDPAALEGRIFKVTAVDPFKDYDMVTRLTLNDGKETIYYKYDDDKSFYPFEVIGGITYPDDFYDGYITPYEGGVSTEGYETVDRRSERVIFRKEKGKAAVYKVILKLPSDIPANGKKGATILLENGTELKFPAASVHDWAPPKGVRTIITLTAADVQALKTQKIVGFTILGKAEQIAPDMGHYLNGVFRRLIAK